MIYLIFVRYLTGSQSTCDLKMSNEIDIEQYQYPVNSGLKHKNIATHFFENSRNTFVELG